MARHRQKKVSTTADTTRCAARATADNYLRKVADQLFDILSTTTDGHDRRTANDRAPSSCW
eukprot:4148920-Pyramimonas_sp.AAC.1